MISVPANVGSVVFVLTDKKELLAGTQIFAFSVFTVDVLWRKLAFLSLFHFADDGSDTGAHAVRAQGQCTVSSVIDSSVNSDVINISRLSSLQMPL